MKSTTELYTELKTLFEQFDEAHNGTKKRNRADARKALGEMKKLITPYRQSSVNEVNEAKVA